MKTVTVAQMRELDRRTIEEFGTPGEILMERAGLGVARAVRGLAEWRGGISWPVYLFAGKGNNGGDIFVAARYLKEWGADVQVWLSAQADEVKGDALTHLKLMQASGVALDEIPDEEAWKDRAGACPEPCVLVDGLLGTGASGAPRGAVGAAIDLVNSWAVRGLVVAVDIPSGVNGDTGEVAGSAVVADLTVTMGLPKIGMLQPSAIAYTGPVEVVDIGIPDDYIDAVGAETDLNLICEQELYELLPRRARDSHKGNYGRALLIGGAKGYAGAITMSARAALRSGSGLVTALVPRSIADVVAGSVLEAMIKGVSETDEGTLSSDLLNEWEKEISGSDALLIGPGLTRGAESRKLVKMVLKTGSAPVVIDADAISVFGGEPSAFKQTDRPVVLTPHPGELAKLLGRKTGEIQADRHQAARDAAELTGATVILKGAGTIVAVGGKGLFVNTTGNPGMASGGTGDVLAGIAVSLLGQGLEPCDAACLAVYVHGRAGDRAAWRGSQAGLIASDLINELPAAFAEICFR